MEINKLKIYLSVVYESLEGPRKPGSTPATSTIFNNPSCPFTPMELLNVPGVRPGMRLRADSGRGAEKEEQDR
jgi:hypothetical protein